MNVHFLFCRTHFNAQVTNQTGADGPKFKLEIEFNAQVPNQTRANGPKNTIEFDSGAHARGQTGANGSTIVHLSLRFFGTFLVLVYFLGVAPFSYTGGGLFMGMSAACCPAAEPEMQTGQKLNSERCFYDRCRTRRGQTGQKSKF